MRAEKFFLRFVRVLLTLTMPASTTSAIIVSQREATPPQEETVIETPAGDIEQMGSEYALVIESGQQENAEDVIVGIRTTL